MVDSLFPSGVILDVYRVIHKYSNLFKSLKYQRNMKVVFKVKYWTHIADAFTKSVKNSMITMDNT